MKTPLVGPGPASARLRGRARIEERPLVELTRAGFVEIYDRHAERVFAICLRMVGDREQAEELTQDVFVHVWENRGRYREEGAIGGWLSRLTVNLVLNRRRSEQRRTRREDMAREPGPNVAHGPEAEERIDLERAVAALPERAREVLVLHDIEGYPQAEVARLMGTAVGTVKAQLHRARRLLRESLYG